MSSSGHTLHVVDSHTEGEPTRVVLEGLPELGSLGAAERLTVLRERCDDLRAAAVCEPRGFDAMVGAFLFEPRSPEALAQVVYFNNVGYLGMCVHGTIGVAETLRHLGRLPAGSSRLETPVGDVLVEPRPDGSIAVENVESYRTQAGVQVETERHGRLCGDVAWGGNWFFLCDDHGLKVSRGNLAALEACSLDLRRSLERQGVRGDDAREIDHVELFGAPTRPDADSKNFVLCPGGQYDRSPCGTGTSAKLACLAAEGKLAEGAPWRQESILGTRFVCSARRTPRGVVPSVSGRAWITAESTLVLADGDPFRAGIRP